MPIILTLVLGLLVSSSAAAQEALSGDALKAAVAGKTVHLETPVGSMPIVFIANGTLKGRSLTLASVLGTAEDHGRWWVSNEQLCQQWNTWLDKATHCVRLTRTGDRVQWVSDSGRSGTARISSK